MVKLNGPMMSMDASGTIGDTITFSKWKGRSYARQRVIPSNPQTGPQTGIRAMMKFLSQQWKGLTAPNKATWVITAAQTAISPFNAYCAFNVNRWRSFKGPSKETPADETAPAASADDHRNRRHPADPTLDRRWRHAAVVGLGHLPVHDDRLHPGL